MTLSRRIFLKNLILIAILIMLATVSMLGLASLRQDAQVALDEYQELRTSEEIRTRLILMSSMLEGSRTVPDEREIQRSIAELQKFAAMQDVDVDEPLEHNAKEKQAALDAIGSLQGVLRQIRSSDAQVVAPKPAAELNALLGHGIEQLHTISNTCDQLIKLTQRAANRGLRRTMIILALLSAVSVAAAVLISLSLSRSILRPLRRLQAGVRRMAEARFSDRLSVEGDREFVELAADFNRMATELDGFYRRLEEMVAAKSRELVRSERLASVGYLAAGVAHEINNPLGIISGHAELLERRLKKIVDPEHQEKAHQALGAIRNEAFRCKEITDRLLSLARQDKTARAVVSLAQSLGDVEVLVHGLKALRTRRIVSRLNPVTEPLNVMGNITEIKQVMLNLVVNALEAVEDHRGEVVIDGCRENGMVVLTISDNGRGIPPQAIEHVFEPFYTDKRGSSAPGTGLGLSITHAIINDHGGSISAFSQGIGKGSCFTVRLPAALKLSEDNISASTHPAPTLIKQAQSSSVWPRMEKGVLP